MDVGQVLEEVGDWFFHEVHMISEMTVESHLQIPSERFLGTQRDQWEPLFQKELPDDMKQIQVGGGCYACFVLIGATENHCKITVLSY